MENIDFELENTFGKIVKLSDYKGKWVILYFYPKDNTSGCTKEALDFTSLKEEFSKLDAEIIGISPDSSASHLKFTEKHNLTITLLSDPDKQVMKKFGAWGLKKNYGKEYEGVIRSTFVISPEGEIAASWSKVKVRVKRKTGEVKHAEKVLEKLKELIASRQ